MIRPAAAGRRRDFKWLRSAAEILGVVNNFWHARVSLVLLSTCLRLQISILSMLDLSRSITSCLAGANAAKFILFTVLAFTAGLAVVTAQTPASSVPAASPESSLTDVAAQPSPSKAEKTSSPSAVPHHSPDARHVTTTTHAHVMPSPATTPRKAGFGSMMPGPSTPASPSPAPARQRKSKKTVAEKTPAPLPNKVAEKTPVREATPATAPTVHVSQSASTPHATPNPVNQVVKAGPSTAAQGGQPASANATSVRVEPAPPPPPPPAEGPIAAPVKQPPSTTVAKPPPVEQPAVVAIPTAVPEKPAPAAAQQPAPKSHGLGPATSAVWVNTETHVYHKSGSRHYGKTKKGQYMTEQEAIAEGDRPAREWIPPTHP